MGVFEAIRKSRAKTKAEVKAAQTHARQLAKQEAKADERVAKLLDKAETVSYTHLTLPTTLHECRSRWSPYH